MKTVSIICANKGGVAKSGLAYLLSLKATDENFLMVDACSASNTTSRQCKHLGTHRTESLSLLNQDGVLVRDSLITYLESIADPSVPFSRVIIDMGSGESDSLPFLLNEYPLLDLCEMLSIKIRVV